jgi:hypothetical protein
MALAAAANHQVALQAKLKALETLRAQCKNSNERAGWISASMS